MRRIGNFDARRWNIKRCRELLDLIKQRYSIMFQENAIPIDVLVKCDMCL